MRARREVTLSVICALLVACSAAASGPDSSQGQTIEGVGILPGSGPAVEVIVSDPTTTVAATEIPTTTVAPLPLIGSLVTGNRLLMIGDSVTASAAKRYGNEWCNTLVPLGWQVEVDAEPSRFVDFGNAVLDKRLKANTKWDAAYVFLGSNYLGDQEAYRKQLEKIVQRLSPIPIVLLTVTLFDESRQQVNDAISLVSAEFPNVRVVDWSSIAAADPTTILRGDGLHLTNAGRTVLASTVAGVLGPAPAPDGDCLKTSFTNDSGASVNGTDIPPQHPIVPTQTTVKPPTATTVPGGGGGGTATTKPPTGTASPTTQPPPTVPQPTSAVPTAPPSITQPRRPPVTPAPTTTAPPTP
jgi:hypothetical protein